MSDYIEQMAKVIYEELTSMNRIPDRHWGDMSVHQNSCWIDAIKTAFQSLWIDIEEHGPPEEGKNIWFCEEDDTIHRGSYEGDGAWWDEDELELISANVTHYMPMFTPPPPKRYSNCK